jgi:hypothetical protein
MTLGLRDLTIQEFLLAYTAGDPAEVERHRERTMNVVSRHGIETITRCTTCPREETRPCTALRILALPYAQHPAYRREWSIDPPSQVPGSRVMPG